jgi:predicted kinase
MTVPLLAGNERRFIVATLFLICGLPGAGKTTLSKQLEHSHSALRLCPDEWIVTLLEDVSNIQERDRLREPVERLQWAIAKRALNANLNVILERGF